MKKTVLALTLLAFSTPAFAQLGGLGGAVRRAQQVQDTKNKIDDLTFTDEEEQTIGADVSTKVRQRFGVVQDPAIHKYVTLVGMTLAKASDRPDLPWAFIVLDTDGVNAFASPGGFVHITRGALGLIGACGRLRRGRGRSQRRGCCRVRSQRRGCCRGHGYHFYQRKGTTQICSD